MADYQFKIHYKPSKENITTDTLSRKEKYENHKKILYAIFKENPDGTILANQKEINYILRILGNNNKEFPILTRKLAIPDNRIKEYIAKYHNIKIGGYSGIGEILRKLRQYCQFPRIKQEIIRYIQECD